MLKEINRKLGEKNTVPSSVGIMADTKGAEIRTGDVETPILIKAGEKVVFSSKPLHEEKMKVIIVNYNEFGKG
jgi:pyruvate kinase